MPGPAAIEHSSESAPVVLTLESKGTDKGMLDLVAHVDATSNFAIPVELSIKLPEGAKLLDGESRQSLPGLPQGRTSRAFRVELPEGAGPVKVVLHGAEPKGAYGFHAEKQYPEAAPPAPFVRPAGAPMARPPVAPRAQRPVSGGAL